MSVWIVTGYKPFELGIFDDKEPAIAYIKKTIEKELRQLLEEGLEWILISGQLGVECWTAEAVFALQEEFSELKLAVITPFVDQQGNWKEDTREYYEMILSQADFVSTVSKDKYMGPQQFRNKNQFFLQKSDGLLIIYDEEKPGNPKYLFEMARVFQERQSYPIRQIDFLDLQSTVEEEQMKENGW